jgi:hypothetical protein
MEMGKRKAAQSVRWQRARLCFGETPEKVAARSLKMTEISAPQIRKSRKRITDCVFVRRRR